MIANSKEMKGTVVSGLAKHLGIKIIRSNQTAPAPRYPYGSYTITIFAGANNGTWQQHEDGVYRKLVRQIWSFTFQSGDNDEAEELASKARSWMDRTGRLYLKDHGVTVQSITDITNRDNFLTVEYEHRSGFDVVFYVYDEDRPTSEETDEIIERVITTRIE